MDIYDQFKEELAVIKTAKLTFCVGFLILGTIEGYAIYSLGFKELMAYKDSQIQTLKEQLSSKRIDDPLKPPTGTATAIGPNGTANTGTIGTINSGLPSQTTKTQKQK